MVRVQVEVRAGVGVRIRFRPEICKLRTHGFEIAQRIVQTRQIGKSRNNNTSQMCSLEG